MRFLRIISPFYLIVAAKLVADGVLRGAGMMKKFMVTTFSDLTLRVALAAVLSKTALGTTGIWLAWPIGWTIATALSLIFYGTADWKNTLKRAKKAFLSKRKTTKRNLKCRRNKSFRKQPNTHETCSVQSRKNAARSADIVRAAFEYSLKIGE